MSTPVTPIIRDCHRLRRHLKALQEEIDRGPRVLKAQQAQLAAAEQAHKESHDALKKWKLKQRDDEGTLKTTEQQLGKLHTRSIEVTTMREMEATRSEIAQATAKKDALENAILEAMGEVEGRAADLPNVEKTWADAQAAFKQSQVEAGERLARMRADQAATEAELAKAEAQLPAAVKPVYAGLVKAQGPDGMAEVKNKVCQGCRTGLTSQKLHELQGGAFVTCSSCGRALYPAE